MSKLGSSTTSWGPVRTAQWAGVTWLGLSMLQERRGMLILCHGLPV